MNAFLSSLSIRWKSPEDTGAAIEIIENATGTMVRNIVSVMAITALVNGNTKIEPKHTQGALAYLHRKCPMPALTPTMHTEQSGGTSLPASFFGDAEPMYSASHSSGGTTETLQFGLGIARSEIAQTGGRGTPVPAANTNRALNKWINEQMKPYLEHHRVTASKTAKADIVRLSRQYLACFLHDLSKKDPITLSKVRDLLKKRKYSIFH
jgi:hypothetical protein